MRSLEQFDRWIAGKVKNWTGRVAGGQHSPQLLEIRRDILEEIRDAIRPAGTGKSVFPYSTVSIRIGAADLADRSALEAALGGDALAEDIRELLAEAGCHVPAGFAVAVEIVDAPELASEDRPFQIAYTSERKTAASAPAGLPATRPRATVKVIRGSAEAEEYEISSTRFNIGRLKEVATERDGLRRRNDLAFGENETTVSREHAYIRYDASSGKYRLYDTNSQRGTVIFRDGRRLDVPRGTGAGLQLRSGDEIHFGNARVVFEITQPEA